MCVKPKQIKDFIYILSTHKILLYMSINNLPLGSCFLTGRKIVIYVLVCLLVSQLLSKLY